MPSAEVSLRTTWWPQIFLLIAGLYAFMLEYVNGNLGQLYIYTLDVFSHVLQVPNGESDTIKYE